MDKIWKSGCGERALHGIAWYSIALVLSKCYLVIGKEDRKDLLFSDVH